MVRNDYICISEVFFTNYIKGYLENSINTKNLIIAFVRPICLPYEDAVEEDYHTSNAMKSHAFWVAGWGATTKRGLYFD